MLEAGTTRRRVEGDFGEMIVLPTTRILIRTVSPYIHFSNENSKFGRNVMRFGGSASLGRYDMKIIKRRVPLNLLDDENDFEQQVEVIRSELNKKKAVEIEREESEKEESILSEKRFDECGISPLTVKALTSAGYVCLEGKDALVKAKTGTGKTAAFLL